MNDVTHLCLFDIPVIGNIPNMVYLAPTCREEYMAMLEWGIRQTEHPVAIRVPANGVVRRNVEPEKDYGKMLNRYEGPIVERRSPYWDWALSISWAKPWLPG